MGIALATLGVFAPARKRILVQIAPRALIGGNMVSLMTASIAGIDIKMRVNFLVFTSFFFLGLLYETPITTVSSLHMNSTLI